MEPWMLDLLKILAPLLLGGSAWIGLGQAKKYRAEARKTEVEAKKLEGTLGPDADAATTAAMKQAIATMRDIAADANASREFAQSAERSMREELARERENSRLQWERIVALEDANRVKERDMIELRSNVTKLGNKLVAARGVVEVLVAYIKTHHADTGDIPRIDYTIFDP